MGLEHLNHENRSRGGKLGALKRWASKEEKKLGKKAFRERFEKAVLAVADAPESKQFKDPLRALLMEMRRDDPTGFVRGVLVDVVRAKEEEPEPAPKTEEEQQREFLGPFLFEQMYPYGFGKSREEYEREQQEAKERREVIINAWLDEVLPESAAQCEAGGEGGQPESLTPGFLEPNDAPVQPVVKVEPEPLPAPEVRLPAPAEPPLSYSPLCGDCDEYGSPCCPRCVSANASDLPNGLGNISDVEWLRVPRAAWVRCMSCLRCFRTVTCSSMYPRCQHRHRSLASAN
jgi:hypothetical protein